MGLDILHTILIIIITYYFFKNPVIEQNRLLKLRIDGLQRNQAKNYDEENEYDNDNDQIYDDSGIEYLKEDILNLYNIITNLSLYTQKKVIGPHNILEFINILEQDYTKEFTDMVNDEYESFKKDGLNDPEITTVMNKQKMWIDGLNEIIYEKLRDKFKHITKTNN
jgi:hypothetical protein